MQPRAAPQGTCSLWQRLSAAPCGCWLSSAPSDTARRGARWRRRRRGVRFGLLPAASPQLIVTSQSLEDARLLPGSPLPLARAHCDAPPTPPPPQVAWLRPSADAATWLLIVQSSFRATTLAQEPMPALSCAKGNFGLQSAQEAAQAASAAREIHS